MGCRSKRLHLTHLNIRSILPKVDKLQYTVKSVNAAVIAIFESKLDESVLQFGNPNKELRSTLLRQTETVEVLLTISEVI